jgi:hypothetical protein
MMMMRFTCYLITRRLSREGHRIEPFFCHERLDIAVHGRDAQPIVVALRGIQCFFWRERPVRLDEGFSYGLFLACIAWNWLWHNP